ncbi:MAG TPA: ABC transporter permease [Candidatus Limnocylindria bacterium]|nr:ABC transporter permease [Candidatus Limnocylindria bacterium]
MRTYVLRRLVYAIPTMLAVITITFLITRLAPGDPVRLYTFGVTDITREDIEALRRAYGLDKSLPEQFLIFMGNAIRLDFGDSIRYHRDAFGLLLELLPNTIQLAVAALLLQLLIGVPLGLVAAVNRGKWIDNVVRFFGTIGHAIPAFWLGLLMIIVMSVSLRLLPSQGMLTIGAEQTDFVDRLKHIIMPAFVLALAGIANFSRYVRTETLDVIRQDYIRTAEAKGLRDRTVFTVHALRNALIPVVTALGGVLAFLVSGALVIEQVFTWPGVGRFVYDAARAKDYPIITAGVVLGATLLIIGYLVRDIMYAVVDPRIKVK